MTVSLLFVLVAFADIATIAAGVLIFVVYLVVVVGIGGGFDVVAALYYICNGVVNVFSCSYFPNSRCCSASISFTAV